VSRAPRIAHVINTPGLGGVPVAVRSLVHALGARCETFVYALSTGDGQSDHREQVAAELRSAGATLRISNATHRLGAIGQLVEWFASDAIDLVHTHSYKPNCWGRLAALVARETADRGTAPSLPLVAHYHNTYDDKWEQDATLGLDRVLAASTQALVACSGAVADHVATRLSLARDRFEVVRNGVDLERFSTGRSTAWRDEIGVAHDVPLIGVIGRLGPQKGQDVLLDALPRLVASHPNARVVFVGAADVADDEAALRSRVQRLNVTDHVIFAGYTGDVRRVYRALDVLAMPSRWEGFGLVAAEALATGTPLVASNLPAIIELTGGGSIARLVPCGDAEALACALDAVLRDPAGTAERIARGITRAGELGWETSADALMTVYDRALGTVAS
jgi:glycosyltransferase involved in cell wall biosynthesis